MMKVFPVSVIVLLFVLQSGGCASLAVDDEEGLSTTKTVVAIALGEGRKCSQLALKRYREIMNSVRSGKNGFYIQNMMQKKGPYSDVDVLHVMYSNENVFYEDGWLVLRSDAPPPSMRLSVEEAMFQSIAEGNHSTFNVCVDLYHKGYRRYRPFALRALEYAFLIGGVYPGCKKNKGVAVENARACDRRFWNEEVKGCTYSDLRTFVRGVKTPVTAGSFKLLWHMDKEGILELLHKNMEGEDGMKKEQRADGAQLRQKVLKEFLAKKDGSWVKMHEIRKQFPAWGELRKNRIMQDVISLIKKGNNIICRSHMSEFCFVKQPRAFVPKPHKPMLHALCELMQNKASRRSIPVEWMMYVLLSNGYEDVALKDCVRCSICLGILGLDPGLSREDDALLERRELWRQVCNMEELGLDSESVFRQARDVDVEVVSSLLMYKNDKSLSVLARWFSQTYGWCPDQLSVFMDKGEECPCAESAARKRSSEGCEASSSKRARSDEGLISGDVSLVASADFPSFLSCLDPFRRKKRECESTRLLKKSVVCKVKEIKRAYLVDVFPNFTQRGHEYFRVLLDILHENKNIFFCKQEIMWRNWDITEPKMHVAHALCGCLHSVQKDFADDTRAFLLLYDLGYRQYPLTFLESLRDALCIAGVHPLVQGSVRFSSAHEFWQNELRCIQRRDRVMCLLDGRKDRCALLLLWELQARGCLDSLGEAAYSEVSLNKESALLRYFQAHLNDKISLTEIRDAIGVYRYQSFETVMHVVNRLSLSGSWISYEMSTRSYTLHAEPKPECLNAKNILELLCLHLQNNEGLSDIEAECILYSCGAPLMSENVIYECRFCLEILGFVRNVGVSADVLDDRRCIWELVQSRGPQCLRESKLAKKEIQAFLSMRCRKAQGCFDGLAHLFPWGSAAGSALQNEASSSRKNGSAGPGSQGCEGVSLALVAGDGSLDAAQREEMSATEDGYPYRNGADVLALAPTRPAVYSMWSMPGGGYVPCPWDDAPLLPQQFEGFCDGSSRTVSGACGEGSVGCSMYRTTVYREERSFFAGNGFPVSACERWTVAQQREDTFLNPCGRVAPGVGYTPGFVPMSASRLPCDLHHCGITRYGVQNHGCTQVQAGESVYGANSFGGSSGAVSYDGAVFAHFHV